MVEPSNPKSGSFRIGARGRAVIVIGVLATALVAAAVRSEPASRSIVAVDRGGVAEPVRPAVDASPSIEPDRPAGPDGGGEPVEPVVAVAPAVVAHPVLVPNARAGDLRVDPEADALPIAYEAPEPALTLLDVRYGPDPAHRLDLRLPAEPQAPVIVYLHAGGWVGGDKQHVPDMATRFVERGYAVASIGYRLAPEHPFPAAVHDVKRAIRWLKALGAIQGSIDPERLVVFGTSAGGHLAAFVGATPGSFEPADLEPALAAVDSSVVGVVSVVGPSDLVTFQVQDHPWARPLAEAFVGCGPCPDEDLAVASPTTHLHPALPPAYFAYGTEDALVDVESQGVALAEAWAAATGRTVSAWLDLVEDHGHNLDESIVNQRAIEAFVDAAVGPGGGDA